MTDRRTFVDMGALYSALDAERARRWLTWRGVASEVGVSPSLLSRVGKGLSPDVTSFMSLCRWLRLPAEGFTVVVGEPREERPAVSAEVATLLARREDVSDLDREYLVGIVASFERWKAAA